MDTGAIGDSAFRCVGNGPRPERAAFGELLGGRGRNTFAGCTDSAGLELYAMSGMADGRSDLDAEMHVPEGARFVGSALYCRGGMCDPVRRDSEMDRGGMLLHRDGSGGSFWPFTPLQ